MSLSHCQQFLLCTDELGDIQVWQVKETGLEALYSNNICENALVDSKFLTPSSPEFKLKSICLSVDNQAYVLDISEREGQVSKVSVEERLSFPSRLPATEADSPDSHLLASPVISVAMVSTSETSDTNCPPNFCLLTSQSVPLFSSLLCLPRLQVDSMAYQLEPRSFATTSEQYYCTSKGLYCYNGVTLHSRLLHAFDSLTKDGRAVDRVLSMQVCRAQGETEVVVEARLKGGKRVFVLVLVNGHCKYVDCRVFEGVVQCSRNVGSGLFVTLDERRDTVTVYRTGEPGDDGRRELRMEAFKSMRVYRVDTV